MPESAGTLYVDIVPRTDKFGDELASQVNAKATPALSRLSSKMTSVGKTASIGLTVPLVALGVKAFGAFEEAAQVAAQTEAAIKSTGGAAGVTAADVGNLADSISRYSGIDDEAIQTAENMLLTFTNVRNEVGKGNDIFNQASGAVADLATRMAKGAAPSAEQLQSASVQLGKALNDPIKGISALTRVGVTFDESQKKTIARLVETGDTLGAQKIILAELTKEFGGSAKAFGDSAAGGAAKAKVAIGNAMESIGEAIAPIAEQLGKFASAISEWFTNLSPGAKKAVTVIGALVAAFGPLVLVIGKLIGVIGTFQKLMEAGKLAWLSNPWTLAIAAIIAAVILIVKNWDKIKAALIAVWNWIKRAAEVVFGGILAFFKRFWPILLGVMTGGVGLIVVLIVKNWNKIKAFVLGVWNAIKRVAGVVWRAIKTVIGVVLKAIGAVFKTYFTVYKTIILTVWNVIKTITLTVWNAIRTVIATVIGRIRDVIRTVINTIKGIWSSVWNAIKSVAVTVWNAIKGVVAGALGILQGIIAGALGGIKAVWDAIWNGIGAVVGAVLGAVQRAVSAALGWIGSLIDKIGDAIGWLSSLVSKIGSAAVTASGSGSFHIPVSGGRELHSGGFVRRETFATIAPGEVVVPLYSRAALDAMSEAFGGGGGGRITGTLTLTPDGRAFVDGRIVAAESAHERFVSNVARMGPG